MQFKFDPGQPDGENQSLSVAISADGTPELGKRYMVPARCGVAVRVKRGQLLSVVNPHGTQVCDFWAFCSENIEEYLSMEHLHTSLNSIIPKVGDNLVTNARRQLLTLIEDTSPGVHDTVVASCDHQRYQQLGCTDYHDNCTDNLRMALTAIGLRAPAVPAPFNLWMNIPVDSDGSIQWLAPVSKPGDRMVFRAEMDTIAVMSACPQDITPVNGDDCEPVELHFGVEAG
ncbi:urea carboxylase-associated family protein [Roseibium sp. SCP14]|uniref:urea carboxylase-associated family protein n=1 Tax=Roseibium sp. SCP14 TaxID=3141375 RepID=UPI0033370EFF